MNYSDNYSISSFNPVDYIDLDSALAEVETSSFVNSRRTPTRTPDQPYRFSLKSVDDVYVAKIRRSLITPMSTMTRTNDVDTKKTYERKSNTSPTHSCAESVTESVALFNNILNDDTADLLESEFNDLGYDMDDLMSQAGSRVPNTPSPILRHRTRQLSPINTINNSLRENVTPRLPIQRHNNPDTIKKRMSLPFINTNVHTISPQKSNSRERVDKKLSLLALSQNQQIQPTPTIDQDKPVVNNTAVSNYAQERISQFQANKKNNRMSIDNHALDRTLSLGKRASSQSISSNQQKSERLISQKNPISMNTRTRLNEPEQYERVALKRNSSSTEHFQNATAPVKKEQALERCASERKLQRATTNITRSLGRRTSTMAQSSLNKATKDMDTQKREISSRYIQRRASQQNMPVDTRTLNIDQDGSDDRVTRRSSYMSTSKPIQHEPEQDNTTHSRYSQRISSLKRVSLNNHVSKSTKEQDVDNHVTRRATYTAGTSTTQARPRKDPITISSRYAHIRSSRNEPSVETESTSNDYTTAHHTDKPMTRQLSYTSIRRNSDADNQNTISSSNQYANRRSWHPQAHHSTESTGIQKEDEPYTHSNTRSYNLSSRRFSQQDIPTPTHVSNKPIANDVDTGLYVNPQVARRSSIGDSSLTSSVAYARSTKRYSCPNGLSDLLPEQQPEKIMSSSQPSLDQRRSRALSVPSNEQKPSLMPVPVSRFRKHSNNAMSRYASVPENEIAPRHEVLPVASNSSGGYSNSTASSNSADLEYDPPTPPSSYIDRHDKRYMNAKDVRLHRYSSYITKSRDDVPHEVTESRRQRMLSEDNVHVKSQQSSSQVIYSATQALAQVRERRAKTAAILNRIYN